MNTFNISWNMRNDERCYNEKTRYCFWTRELNDDWKLKCVCEQNKLRNPDFIEVHRRSLVGECMISGTLEIHAEKQQQCLLKKKFFCLLENGSVFARIYLHFPQDDSKRPLPKILIMTGQMIISACTEASNCLTNLVHLPSSDYSSLSLLSDDMRNLLNEKSLLADVTVKFGSVSMPAHKSILSARSPVFKAMFSCPLKEAVENEVIIKDFEDPVLETMVKYMYSGRIEGLTPSLAVDLLFAANKYQVASLETACRNYLTRNMSMKNALNILVIGHFVSPDMKNFAIDFICTKCTDYSALEKTTDWISLKNKNPALALEIFSCVVKSQEEKLKKRT